MSGQIVLTAQRIIPVLQEPAAGRLPIVQMLQASERADRELAAQNQELFGAMQESIEQFRTQLGAAIDSVEFVKRALDRQVPENDRGEGTP